MCVCVCVCLCVCVTSPPAASVATKTCALCAWKRTRRCSDALATAYSRFTHVRACAAVCCVAGSGSEPTWPDIADTPLLVFAGCVGLDASALHEDYVCRSCASDTVSGPACVHSYFDSLTCRLLRASLDRHADQVLPLPHRVHRRQSGGSLLHIAMRYARWPRAQLTCPACISPPPCTC